jgi:hypothetical protein
MHGHVEAFGMEEQRIYYFRFWVIPRGSCSEKTKAITITADLLTENISMKKNYLPTLKSQIIIDQISKSEFFKSR